MTTKRDLSISLERANALGALIVLPVMVLQFLLFVLVKAGNQFEMTVNFPALLLAIVLGIVAHELLHGAGWMLFGCKPLSAIKFGVQWKALTPYAHLKEPIEVNAYRIGGFLPGFVLGIVPYGLSLVLRNDNLFWFGLVHTSAAAGDWLVLWLLRHVKAGTLVEDHPTQAGCYVLEP